MQENKRFNTVKTLIVERNGKPLGRPRIRFVNRSTASKPGWLQKNGMVLVTEPVKSPVPQVSEVAPGTELNEPTEVKSTSKTKANATK